MKKISISSLAIMLLFSAMLFLVPHKANATLATPDDFGGFNIIFRLYNPNSGEHFYTGVEDEGQNLEDAGWTVEGFGWIAPVTGVPVFRLYNPNAGDHHYTVDTNERDFLKTKGWNYEGIAFYSDGDIPVYRAYNPNATGAGAHNYTTDKNEQANLVSKGWKDEGISFYGLMAGMSIQEMQAKYPDAWND